MEAHRQFVCGFYGARDAYEVPLALEEAGLLASLLTDFYGEVAPLTKLGVARAARWKDGLPAQKVHGSLLLTAARQLAGRLFRDGELRNHLTDLRLSRRIARQAARIGASILTYEPYAVPRPNGGFPGGCRQVVFYYHPHVDTEDEIYRDDEERFPEFYGRESVTSSPWRRRTADAWKHADLVLCASSFTKQSLVAAGMEERRIAVVPYGGGDKHEAIGMRQEAECQRSEVGGRRSDDSGSNPEAGSRRPEIRDPRPEGQGLRLLFVGRNPLRKGLHHLLMAWDAAKKSQGDLLTIVCAAKPLEMQRLVEGRNDVRWVDSLSGDELARLYRESDALVVPSLCEGFGHVYLEAMSHGCAVVGTRNSALPDIGDEGQGVFSLEVGDVDGLGELISRASADADLFRQRADAAKTRAADFTWSKFRQKIVAAVQVVNS